MTVEEIKVLSGLVVDTVASREVWKTRYEELALAVWSNPPGGVTASHEATVAEATRDAKLSAWYQASKVEPC